MTITWKRNAAIAVLALSAIFFVPRVVLAADASLYELTENMKINKFTNGSYRSATSQLAGWANVGTPLCPKALVVLLSPGATTCRINATGRDNINTGTGLGSFWGTYTVVVQGDNPVDGPEFVVSTGAFFGQMDFSPALVNRVPYGTVKGYLVSSATGTASFTGVFRLPFAGNYAGPETGGATLRQVFCPLTPDVNAFAPYFGGTDVAYVDTASDAPNGRCINVQPTELSLGEPTVRFDISF
ncbi:MAG TPA: hypothetical protein VGL09_15820 [Methylomirabilota bacterium]|jgi:hypothetical protein